MRILISWAISIALFVSAAAAAQSDVLFKREELQQLVAPIALYPDALLAQVLMASTYPLQVAQGARWQVENAKLTGAALEKALADKDWDPSVKSIISVPSVLKMMNDKLEWTQKLGDAFLAQQKDVMNEVQFLRAKAMEAGNLASNKQQKVTKQSSVIIIEPASTQIVYVPVYSPTVVYGAWWYPAYPPYYFPPPAGAAFVSGFFWGSAVAISANYWGWGRCDWHRTNIDVDINRYNQINVNRAQITSNTWRHDPVSRGPVPYRDARTREQFKSTTREAPASRTARGFEGGNDRAAKVRADQKANLPQAADRRPAEKVTRPSPSTSPDRVATANRQRGNAARATAFDAGSAQSLRAGSDRGHKSREAMRDGRTAGAGGGRNIGGRR